VWQLFTNREGCLIFSSRAEEDTQKGADMRKAMFVLLIFAAAVSCATMGCTRKAASSAEAIRQSETMQTAGQKADYLIGQANAFLSSRDYSEAIKTAQYVLSNLDQNSKEAKAILDKARNKLSEQVNSMMEDVKKSMNNAVK